MPPNDYSGQNLRGRSFRNKNLEGANFSYADIRSADFTGALLISANFSHAKAGLQKRWAALLVLVSWLIAALAGFFSAFLGASISYIFDSSNLSNQVSAWAALIVIQVAGYQVQILTMGAIAYNKVAVAHSATAPEA